MKLVVYLRTAMLAVTLAIGSLVAAAPAHAWWSSDYAYRTRINLNANAANLSGEAGPGPVLVRLHQGNFNFADVKADGSDLRFVAGDDRTELNFHFERWSPEEQQALIWVAAPALAPDASESIYAYYGNEAAEYEQDEPGTYGADYRLVWHFAGDGALRDSTANGLSGSGAAQRNPRGLIGPSLVLSGASVVIPAAAFQAGPTSLSFWARVAGNGQLVAAPGAALTLNGGQLALTVDGQQSTGAALPQGWTHVALVSDGGATRLFINGEPAGEVAAGWPGLPAALGRGLTGEIDELRVVGSALPQAAFQLAVASEGQSPRLLSFDNAEQLETGGRGYIGILFNALTIDAWVVIILLGLMLLISWWVMASKGVQLARVSAANEDFLEAYQRASLSRSDHAGLADLNPATTEATSSLGNLYRIGQRELEKRLREGREAGSRYAIRPQSIAAIRSALDAGQVREGQRLNRRMVLLTIAISGGPFLGLLGTVIGVMITFASVAAAGDVNINAIAPGIAAALLATVAGLAVAIPALFGYNYLLSRAEEISADNQIFVDELEKRIAETWQDNDPPTGPDSRRAPPPDVIAAE